MADFRNNVHDSDESLQMSYTGDNIIPCKTDHQISDGQKRYGTLLGDTSSNYPKPKTMFYVSFNYADGYTGIDDGEIASKTLSKYVVDVTKPNVRFTTKKMNQYNRIKYVYENVEYGDLKITFMDTKNSNLEQILFKFLRNVDKDFYHHRNGPYTKHNDNKNYNDRAYNSYAQNSDASYGYQWGLHARSNERLFKSITIAEMYFDRLTVFTVENPLISDISFGDNKISDYSPNKITVTFKVEGITNDIIIDKNNKEYYDVIGNHFTSVGGADMAHFLEKRWNPGNGEEIKEEKIFENPRNLSNYQTVDYRQMQVDRSNEKLKRSMLNEWLEKFIEINNNYIYKNHGLEKINPNEITELSINKKLLEQLWNDDRDLENESEKKHGYTWYENPYTGRKTLVRKTGKYKFENHSQTISLFKF